MRIITLIFVLIILLLGITFAVLNAASVTVHYYYGVANMPLSLALVFALILGVIIGLICSFYMVLKAKAAQRQLRKQISTLQKMSIDGK